VIRYQSPQMNVVEKNKVVTVHYTLKEEGPEGQLIEETYGNTPLTFIFGIGQMIPGFESNLVGRKEGDDYAFLLQPGEAYGDSNVNAVVKIPKQNFADQNGDVNPEVIALGAPVNMKNQEGKSFQGIVKEATEDTITVDFNHPMAGRTLHFSGTIIEVRSAREDELTKGFSSID